MKYQNNFNWYILSKKLNLNIIKKIIETKKDLIEWYPLSQNRNLTQEFIIKYIKKLFLGVLIENPACNLHLINYFVNTNLLEIDW